MSAASNVSRSEPDSVSVELIKGRWTVLVWRNREFLRKFVCADSLDADRIAAEMQGKGLKRVKAGGRK